MFLACGFTPLHVANYMAAHLQLSMPASKVSISPGLYGDLAGTIQDWLSRQPLAGVVLLEWADLDLRLGFRSLGGWGQKVVPSILDEVRNKLEHLRKLIDALSSSCRIVVMTPSLPLPPAFHTTSFQATEAELILTASMAEFTRQIAAHPAVSVVRMEKLNATSPPEARYDLRSDMHAGFPYSISHADAVGQAVANLLRPPETKKGLITDLDDTFWLGLAGEIGPENVAWDLSNHAQIHGLYQQMLQSLADQGVLVGVASKNTPEIAGAALSRPDCVMAKDNLFPLEIHWEQKSRSVARILKAWNVGPDAVVFVDDNPLELEEVKLSHPEVECLLFPKTEYNAFWIFLNRLRDLFGKARLSEEDSYRLASIREGAAFSDAELSGDETETLMAGAGAEILFDFKPAVSDLRLLELINKTNQFNLNGERLTSIEWQRRLSDPDTITISAQYKDKFGPLGKIAALQARRDGKTVRVESWVMSCRAFARRIEHQMLAQLFDSTGADFAILEFVETARNGPFRAFLGSLLDQSRQDSYGIERDSFAAKCPALYHRVTKQNG